MQHPAIHSIDEGVNGLFQLVIETAGNQTTLACFPAMQGEIPNTALDPLFGKTPVNAFDDIVALPKHAEGWLGRFR